MLDLLENALAKRTGAWLELRLHDRRSRSILVEDGVLEAARATRHCGVGVRAFVDGGWGFASTSVLTHEALLRMIDAAVDAARAAALGRTKKALPRCPRSFATARSRARRASPCRR